MLQGLCLVQGQPTALGSGDLGTGHVNTVAKRSSEGIEGGGVVVRGQM